MIQKITGRALVLGMGASGLAASRLLVRHGWRVSIVDQRKDAQHVLEQWPLPAGEVELLLNTDTCSAANTDFAVISPGFPHQHPMLMDLRLKQITVIPEFELGLAFMPGVKVVAITGTNGKSSLVKWIADTLTAAGFRARPAGNFGIPPSDLAADGVELDVVVLELSSFQLEQLVDFVPDAAVVLNLTPNHLDRHKDFEEYARAKSRLFKNMQETGVAIIHAPAWEVMKSWVDAGLRPLLFGEGLGFDIGFYEGSIHPRGKSPVDLRGTWWGDRPLGVNAAAGVAVLDLFGVGPEVIQSSAAGFTPLPHRLEEFTVWQGVRFVNDSKASTLSALAAAVASGTEKKHLIAGGILKEADVNFVKEVLAKNCAFVYCIGTIAEKLVQSWGDVVPCEDCHDLEFAVKAAFQRAKKGEVVLLSPGCSSFDQFTNYAHRGKKFKELVHLCIQQNRKTEITMQGVRI